MDMPLLRATTGPLHDAVTLRNAKSLPTLMLALSLAGCHPDAGLDRVVPAAGKTAGRPAAALHQSFLSQSANESMDAGVGATQNRESAMVSATPTNAQLQALALKDRRSIPGQALNAATLSIPSTWRLVDYIDALRGKDCAWTAGGCPLWLAASVDGLSSVEIVEPQRRSEYIPANGGKIAMDRKQAALALDYLTDLANHRIQEPRIIASDGLVDPPSGIAVLHGTRGTVGSAWLLAGYESGGHSMRELLAVTLLVQDVSNARKGGRDLHIEILPALFLRMPEADFDASLAEAIRASLRVDAQWRRQWWHVYESKVVGEQCAGITDDGLCRREEGHSISYFQTLESLGVWDWKDDP